MNNSIINAILEQNPWWSDPSVTVGNAGKSPRNIFETIKTRVMDRELITAIIGLRRVGKTILVKQVIHFLMESGIDRKKIIYFSCENQDSKYASELLKEIINHQVNAYPNEKTYFFFDEIQYIDGWNVILKKYVDLYPKLKFTITGSASLFIATHARESLAGRIQEIVVRPMGYAEYLRIHKNIIIPAVTIFEDVEPLIAHSLILEENFQPYVAWGEFPYLASLPTWEEKREYVLEFVLRKVLEVDLPKLKRYNGTELSRLMDILVIGSGQLVEMKNLGNDIGLSQNTLRDYLDTLEKTYLISQVFNSRIGYRTRSVRQRKIYVNSVNAVVLQSGLTFDPHAWQTKAGLFVENYVFNYFERLGGVEIDFWRERQIREVDFVCNYQGSKLPIEVKYQSQIRPDDLKNIIYYCNKEKLTRAVVITKNKIGVENIHGLTIQFTPAHFLV